VAIAWLVGGIVLFFVHGRCQVGVGGFLDVGRAVMRDVWIYQGSWSDEASVGWGVYDLDYVS
jgi:hypothetical protein